MITLERTQIKVWGKYNITAEKCEHKKYFKKFRKNS